MADKNVKPENRSGRRTLSEWLIVFSLAVGLTYFFFDPLWTGGGLIGGDLYTYFMPQKQFYAERLAEGEFPLWNNRSGYGYPLVAESQTGAFYPPHLVLYSTFDVTTAYNLNQILHYVATFMLVWLYAREVGVRSGGAVLAALVFTYGWFPPRLCLEWAILGGPYLPLQLWLVERLIRTGDWRYPIWISMAGGLQLLAGHFNLAFITDVVVVLYLPLRLCLATEDVADRILADRTRAAGLTVAALALGFAVAAIQLVPTWELKQASQRTGDLEGGNFDPGYGHIPPLYLSQVAASWWWWYAPEIDRDRALQMLDTCAWDAGTNQVEAHLYFGLLPLLLVIGTIVSRSHRSDMLTRFHLIWLVLGLAAVVYATGWLIPILQYVPGFVFFRGPGRYGIVTTLGMAVAAGAALNTLLKGRSRLAQTVVPAVVLVLTAWEFQYISRTVTYAFQLERTPIQNLESSPIRKHLNAARPLVRLYAPGPNLTNLLGVSSVPEYLGLGPAEYYEQDLKARSLLEATTPRLREEFTAWAAEHGMTHLLTFEPLAETSGWQLLYQGPDPFLNPAWARGAEPLYLYSLAGSTGRAFLLHENRQTPVRISHSFANEVEVLVDSPQGGRLVLRDLMFPGWEVTVNGEPARPLSHARLFRAVELSPGKHTVVWRYRPDSLRIGLWITVLALCVLPAAGLIRYRRVRRNSA